MDKLKTAGQSLSALENYLEKQISILRKVILKKSKK